MRLIVILAALAALSLTALAAEPRNGQLIGRPTGTVGAASITLATDGSITAVTCAGVEIPTNHLNLRKVDDLVRANTTAGVACADHLSDLRLAFARAESQMTLATKVGTRLAAASPTILRDGEGNTLGHQDQNILMVQTADGSLTYASGQAATATAWSNSNAIDPLGFANVWSGQRLGAGLSDVEAQRRATQAYSGSAIAFPTAPPPPPVQAATAPARTTTEVDRATAARRALEEADAR